MTIADPHPAARTRVARRAALVLALLEAACATTEATSSLESQTEVAAEAPPVRRRRRRARRTEVSSPRDPSAPSLATREGNLVDGATHSVAPAPAPVVSPPPSPFAPRRPAARLFGAPATGTPDAPEATFGTPVGNPGPRGPQVSVRLGRDDRGAPVGRCVRDEELPTATAFCPQCAARPNNAAIVRAFYPAERAVLACRPPADRRGRFSVRARFDRSGVATEVSSPGSSLTDEGLACLTRALCNARVPTFREPTATLSYEYVVLLPADE